MRHLCISVSFLDNYYHGKGDEAPEWPPSPMRLFQALLAGSHAGGRSVEWSKTKNAAFRWLEGRRPPRVLAPDAAHGSVRVTYVPINEWDKEPQREKRLKTKVVAPHLLPEHARIHYLWAISDDEWAEAKPHAELLCAEARHLLALGWGIDQVVGMGQVIDDAGVDALVGLEWLPSGRNRKHRVPKAGSLADLQAVHSSFVSSIRDGVYHPPAKPGVYDITEYRRQDDLPQRPFAVFELPDEVAFSPENIVKVAAMLRSLACDQAKLDEYNFPGDSEKYVAGHVARDGNEPRFSYLPLPTIGHEHADGLIRRLLIAEPFGGDGQSSRWAEERIAGRELSDKDGVARGTLSRPWRKTTGNMVERYTGESRTWCSVTPVILPGYDEGKQVKAESLLFKSIRQAGIPESAIAHMTMRKAPFWPGSLYAHQYFQPNYLNRFPGWHVRIEFHRSFTGPLSIGAGRHAGLGVFAKWGTD